MYSVSGTCMVVFSPSSPIRVTLKEAMQVTRPILLLFKPNALAIDTEEGRTLVTLEVPATEATGTTLVLKAAAAAIANEELYKDKQDEGVGSA